MSPPPCDRHKNLQMVPLGQTFVHACPVPSCGRCHDEQGYFEVIEAQLVRGETTAPNRLFSTEEKILKAIRARAGV